LGKLSHLLGNFRWLFMPLGLFALVAVGIHVAADRVDDRILWAVDRLDAAWDSFWGQWDLTSFLVNVISLERRTRFAHGVTLCWELLADMVLALPALGYREQRPAPDLPTSSVFRSILPRPAGWRGTFRKLFSKPTTLRWTRPLCTAAMALAGSCSLAQMVQGTVFLSLRSHFGDDVAGPSSRMAAVLALGGAAVCLGWRAVLRSLQHADNRSDEFRSRLDAIRVGLLGTLVVTPLAVLAVLEASPVLSFFQ
jgi:hypothetical protein